MTEATTTLTRAELLPARLIGKCFINQSQQLRVEWIENIRKEAATRLRERAGCNLARQAKRVRRASKVKNASNSPCTAPRTPQNRKAIRSVKGKARVRVKFLGSRVDPAAASLVCVVLLTPPA